MNSNNLIALMTDFGQKDGFVGTMKGIIYNINPGARIVDISHDISPQNLHEASFVLQNSYKYFPKNTIFLAVIDPQVGSSRMPLVIKTEKYFFVGPDNGIFSSIYRDAKNADIFELKNKNYFLDKISKNFHGRDIFAPVCAYLSKGLEPCLMGERLDGLTLFEEKKALMVDNTCAAGNIIYIDKFGNLITNFSEPFLEKNFINKDITIEIKGKSLSLHNSYSDVPIGEGLAIEGSSGYIEIAVNQGNAKELFNVNYLDKVYCRKNSI